MTGPLKGKIYVVGVVTNTSVLADNQVYDPVANTWGNAAAMPVTTFDGATAVVKSTLCVFGGSQDGATCINAVWAYNPKTNTWSRESCDADCEMQRRGSR